MRHRGHILIPLAAAITAACAGGRATTRQEAAPAAAAAAAPAAAPIETGRSIDTGLQAVRFGFDSARLDEEARQALRSNAGWLKSHPGLKIRIDGHCDQRGTAAYNLALGQRRAAAVRAYYRKLGVAAARLKAVSDGKEHPVCQEMDESCWSRNRRAETSEAAGAKVANSAP